MSQAVAETTETREAVPDARVLPFLFPVRPSLREHTEIIEHLQAAKFLPEVFPPYHEKEQQFKSLPKVLVVGTDEQALVAGERLMEAGFAVIFAEEEARPESLMRLGEERAKWGLGVLSHRQALVLTNCHLSAAEIEAAGFSGVVLSKELDKPRTHTEVDMSLPLVVPARTLTHPGFHTLDFDRKIPNPDDLGKGKRFGRLHGGQLGRVGIYGYDPLEAITAAQKVATMHVADAAARKHRMPAREFRHDALVSPSLREAAERLGLAPGEVGTTTLILPNDAYLPDVGVTVKMLEQNHITPLHHAEVLGATASPSPEIIHVNVRHHISELNVSTGAVGFSGLVIADGRDVDYGTNSLTMPVVRIGSAAGLADDTRDESTTAGFIRQVQERRINRHADVFRFVDRKTTNEAQRMGFVAHFMVSEMPIFWNGHVGQKEQTEDQTEEQGASESYRSPAEIARSAWKLKSADETRHDNEVLFGPEAKPAPFVGVIGDGVAGATAAKALVEKGYRVIVFGTSPGGEALRMIDEVAHHKTRFGGEGIVMRGIERGGVHYIHESVDLAKLPELVNEYGLSGLIVAAGGQERRDTNIDYSIPGVMTLREFIGDYNGPLNAGKPVTEVDFGLPVPRSQYPNMRVAWRGAGRGVEDIAVKLRYMQAMIEAEKQGISPETIVRSALFDGPSHIPAHQRMAHHFKSMGIDLHALGEAIGIHRGGIADFKWNDPRDHHLKEAILLSQRDVGARAHLRELFEQNPFLSPDRVVSLFVRRFDSEFRAAIEKEVRQWQDGYAVTLFEHGTLLGIERTERGKLLLRLTSPVGDKTEVVDMFVDSLGSEGIKLPFAQIVRPDGLVVPIELAGMSFDGRGAVGPSVKHAEKQADVLDVRMKKAGAHERQTKDGFRRTVLRLEDHDNQSGFDGSPLHIVVNDSSLRGAFSEFHGQTVPEKEPDEVARREALYREERLNHLIETVQESFDFLLHTYAQNIALRNEFDRTHDLEVTGEHALQERILRQMARRNGFEVRPYTAVGSEDGSPAGVEITVRIPKHASEEYRTHASRLTSIRVAHDGHIYLHNGATWQQVSGDYHLIDSLFAQMGLGSRNMAVDVPASMYGLQGARRRHLAETVTNLIPEAAHGMLYQMPNGAARITLFGNPTRYDGSVFVNAEGRLCRIEQYHLIPDGGAMYRSRLADMRPVQVETAEPAGTAEEVVPQGNELLEILARAHDRKRQDRAELFNRHAELGLPVDRRSGIALPEVPPVETPIRSLDALREAVTTRRQAQTKAMVLAHLRDTLVARAHEGGYNDPVEAGLPDADMLNILMNLTEDDIVLRHYYIGQKDRINKDDEEWHTADYISLRLYDERRGIDEERDLRIRMLRTGDFQYQRGGRWYTARSVNSLRQALGRPFGAHIAPYEHDGYAYMDMFKDRLMHERGRAGLIYVLGQLDRMGVKDETTVDQFTFIVRQLIVSPEGNLFLRRYDGRTREESLEWLLTNGKTRKAISRMLRTAQEMPSPREQLQEDMRDFLEKYQYAASLTLGLFAKAGLTHVMQDPSSLNCLAGLGVAWGGLFNRLMARVKHGYVKGSVDFRMVQIMERVTGHVAAFGAGVLLSEPVSDLLHRFGDGPTDAATLPAEVHQPPQTHTPSTSVQGATPEPQVDHGLPGVQPGMEVGDAPSVPIGDGGATVSSFDASIYHGQWHDEMIRVVQQLGGTEGWTNTIDNNGVSQAEVMAHWRILLQGKIPAEDLSRLMNEIAQTKNITEYMQLRETILEEVRTLLAN